MKRKCFVFLALLFLSCDASQTDLQLIPATAAEVMDVIKNANANVVLVNVWATWCVPCVEEFPDIMAVYQQYKSRGFEGRFCFCRF